MFGIFPNDAAILLLVCSQLLELQEEWQLERRHFSKATMAKIPQPEDLLEISDGNPSVAASAAKQLSRFKHLS